MKLARKVGATSEIWQIFIADSSSSTGAGLTGLAYNTAGLTAYYHRDTDTTATAISLVTMTVGTFTSSGFKEIDATNMPGWYQFCPPNAALASGAKSCAFHLKGATNMAPLPIEVDLDAQVDVTHWTGTAVASPATAGIPEVNVKNINNVSTSSVTTVSAYQGSTGAAINGTTVNTLASHDPGATIGTSTLTQAQVTGGTYALNSASFAFNAALDFTTTQKAATIATVTNLTNAPTNGDLTATMKASVTTAATAATPTVAAVTGNVGGNVVGTVSGVTPATNAQVVSAVSGLATSSALATLQTTCNSIGTIVTTINADTDDIQSRLPAALVGGRMDVSVGAMAANTLTASALATDAAAEIASAVLTTALTESYAADGAAPTLSQFMFMMWSFDTEAANTAPGGGVGQRTVMKLDGVTPAMTFTYDSPNNPTSITRAS